MFKTWVFVTRFSSFWVFLGKEQHHEEIHIQDKHQKPINPKPSISNANSDAIATAFTCEDVSAKDGIVVVLISILINNSKHPLLARAFIIHALYVVDYY